jgi:hypothetical protein
VRIHAARRFEDRFGIFQPKFLNHFFKSISPVNKICRIGKDNIFGD